MQRRPSARLACDVVRRVGRGVHGVAAVVPTKTKTRSTLHERRPNQLVRSRISNYGTPPWAVRIGALPKSTSEK